MHKNEKIQISEHICDAERYLRRQKLNPSEKLALQKVIEAEYWLWADDPDAFGLD